MNENEVDRKLNEGFQMKCEVHRSILDLEVQTLTRYCFYSQTKLRWLLNTHLLSRTECTALKYWMAETFDAHMRILSQMCLSNDGNCHRRTPTQLTPTPLAPTELTPADLTPTQLTPTALAPNQLTPTDLSLTQFAFCPRFPIRRRQLAVGPPCISLPRRLTRPLLIEGVGGRGRWWRPACVVRSMFMRRNQA